MTWKPFVPALALVAALATPSQAEAAVQIVAGGPHVSISVPVGVQVSTGHWTISAGRRVWVAPPRAHVPQRWVPGHYEHRGWRRVWVPGHYVAVR